MAVNRAAVEPVFGPWLARRRRVLDLTQAELAERVGCSESTIRKLEADDRRPSKRVAISLASALRVPDAETPAFVAFARTGWSDRPPAGRAPGPAFPWAAADDRAPTRAPGVQTIPEDPTVDGEGSAVAGHRPGTRRRGAPFVARREELSRLDRALDLALAGRGQVRLIAGEAGQGKTALLTAFARRARKAHPELLTASGSCNAYTGGGDPFLPFRDILEELAAPVARDWGRASQAATAGSPLPGEDPFVVEALVRHGPHVLDALVPATTLRRLTEAGLVPAELVTSLRSDRSLRLWSIFGATGQHALSKEATTVLTRVSRRAPLLLVLDDLQWADSSSLDLLHHLARSAGQSRILVLAAFRPQSLPRAQADAGHPLRQLTREIARLFEDAVIDLDRADGRAFLDGWLDSQPNRLGAGFRGALLRQTGGQPLFTIELLRAMQQRGALTLDVAGRWVSAAEVHWEALPARVSAALAERIETLDAPSRSLLRVASVEGEAFTAEVAARVLGEDPAGVAALTSRLDREHRLIEATGVTRAASGVLSRFRFRHNLIQRYVYGELGESELVYLHQAVGESLEALFGRDVDPLAVAFHYGQAHAPDRAARFHRLAGDRATAAGALAQAISHYREAVAHWPEEDAAARASLLCDLGECQFDHGLLQDAEKTLEAAHAALLALGRVRAAGAVETALGRTYHERGDHARGLATCLRAVAALEGEGESAELAMALVLSAAMYMVVSDYGPALDLGRRALRMAERFRAEKVRAGALVVVGTVLAAVDPARREDGFAMLDEARSLGDRVGTVQFACDAIINSALRLLAVDRFAHARRQFQRSKRYARTRQIGLVGPWAAHGLWLLDWRRGDWKRALRRLPGVEKLAAANGEWSRGPARLQVALAATDVDLGRIEQAAARLDAHQPWLSRNTLPHGRAPYLRERLRVAVARGRAHEADGAIQDLLAMIGDRSTHSDKVMAPLLTGIRWLVRNRAHDDAAVAFIRALEQTERQYACATARATATEARGILADVAGDTHAASGDYLRAAQLWASVRFPLDEARARGLAAHALARLGRSDAAVSERQRGRALVAALSAQLPSQALVRSFRAHADPLLENPSGALP